MMDVKPLHNEQDYDWAVREVTRYFEAEPVPGTADGDRFEVLSTLIKEYEDKTLCNAPWRPRRRLAFRDRIHGQVASPTR